MNKTQIIAILPILLIGLAGATTWHIDVTTSDLTDTFEGDVATGVVNYGVDNTGTDPWNGHEVAKISRTATWTGGGKVSTSTAWTCPGVTSSAKYGSSVAYDMINTDDTGYMNTNTISNYIHDVEGAGPSYPHGYFPWASYGNELKATGNYELGTALYEATSGSGNHFDYYMAGSGSGKIKYGNAGFTAGPNWGDGHGSVSLSREYNSAEATGSGQFVEDLSGEDYLKNYKFELPHGGTIQTTVTYNDGMEKTPIWVSAK